MAPPPRARLVNSLPQALGFGAPLLMTAISSLPHRVPLPGAPGKASVQTSSCCLLLTSFYLISLLQGIAKHSSVPEGGGPVPGRLDLPQRSWSVACPQHTNGRTLVISILKAVTQSLRALQGAALLGGSPALCLCRDPLCPSPDSPLGLRLLLQVSNVHRDRTPAADRLTITVCFGLGLARVWFRNVTK